jgi:L-lactate dehydrogenase complex protein LldG
MTPEDRRRTLLGKVRTALAGGDPDAQRRTAVAERLRQRPRHLTPARVDRPHGELLALFRAFLEGQSATVVDVAGTDEIPAAIGHYLRANNLPSRVRVGADPRLSKLPWEREPTLSRLHGAAAPTDEVGLSHALAGVAETGTMLVASGPDNPVTVNFLPETHIVVVSARDVVGPYEDAFAAVRARFGDGVMPRTLNMISGPSRTGDIGGKLVMGAHGPRRMCVIVVRN